MGISESTEPHAAVRQILTKVTGESVAALRSSGAGRLLQPQSHGGLGVPAGEFVWAVCELAAMNASLGWLAATYNAAALLASNLADDVWRANSDASVTVGHGSGAIANGRLSGRWDGVVGADQADWLLLAIDDGRRVLVLRDRVHVASEGRRDGLHDAGIAEVTAGDVPVELMVNGGDGLIAAAGAAAAVVGSADGLWRKHVDRVRARLNLSYSGDEVTNEAAAEVARAASDIDAAKLQITGALDLGARGAARAVAQSIARARSAADRLLASSRHPLDASGPVSQRWRDVHAGVRLANRWTKEAPPAGLEPANDRLEGGCSIR